MDPKTPSTSAARLDPMLEPAHLWILGLGLDDEGRVIGPGRRRSSSEEDCECPWECPRDHDAD